jgi:hypothetical protein
LLVIKWWLDDGAEPAKKFADYEVPAPVAAALATLRAPAPASASATGHSVKTAATPTTPGDELKATVAGLASQFPGALSFESRESAGVTFSAVSMRGKFDDAAFAKLGPVLPHLVSADFSATLITDRSAVLLGAATNLRQLRLAETGVTDAAIDSLLKLVALESLNFYGTKVTDNGILKLGAIPALKRLYLWQTSVTSEGVKSLQEKLPDCQIVVGGSSAAGAEDGE